MVYAYIGLPGSGKTLTSLALLLSELRAGRHVFTNIAGLDPTMVSYALSAKGRKGEHYGLTYVEKYLHRFTLEYDADVGVKPDNGFAPVANAAPSPVPALNRFATRKLGVSNVVESAPASNASPVVDKSPVAESVYRVKRKTGITSYYNVEGLSLLIKDVMSCKETVVILDECHEYLNPENFAVLRPFVKYISMARHYGHDLILITQHISDIWQPIQKRIHETHEFFRGQLGIRTHYKERVFYGSNILAAPGYVRQRVNDKSLYKLYKSHEGDAKEHMAYMSVFKNAKLLFLFVVFFVAVVFVAFFAPGAWSFVDAKRTGKPLHAVKDTVPRYNRNENVIYVKYVVCSHFDCKAVRPDGTTITLPLDYASGRYPLEVRKYVQNGSSFYPSEPMPGAGSKSGRVQNAR